MNRLRVMQMYSTVHGICKGATRTVDWEITDILEQNMDNPNLYLFLAVCKTASEFTMTFVQTAVCWDFAGVMSIFALRKLINIDPTYTTPLQVYLVYNIGCEIRTCLVTARRSETKYEGRYVCQILKVEIYFYLFIGTFLFCWLEAWNL
jgi:hypothetical protein